MGNVVYVKGRKIDQDKLRAFLEDINMENIDQFQTEDGYWKSPVTGDLFRTKFQLWGQLGSYLRTPQGKDPLEPTRAGYVRAVRRGLEPTPEQKRAHREYAKKYRRDRRVRLMKEQGLEVPPEWDSDRTETQDTKSIPAMVWE